MDRRVSTINVSELELDFHEFDNNRVIDESYNVDDFIHVIKTAKSQGAERIVFSGSGGDYGLHELYASFVKIKQETDEELELRISKQLEDSKKWKLKEIEILEARIEKYKKEIND